MPNANIARSRLVRLESEPNGGPETQRQEGRRDTRLLPCGTNGRGDFPGVGARS